MVFIAKPGEGQMQRQITLSAIRVLKEQSSET